MSATSQILYKSNTSIGDIVIDKYYKYNCLYFLKSICLCDAQKMHPSPLEKKLAKYTIHISNNIFYFVVWSMYLNTQNCSDACLLSTN